MAPKIIPLEDVLPFFKNLYVLNPGFQFYNVVTAWGAFVFLLFILNIKKFRNNAFLMAGMLSPFFTVFNPFFVDLFLRHSWTESLWRLTFMVPLHFVAAYLFVNSIQLLREGGFFKWVYSGLTVLLLVVLLFPIKSTFFENPHSRFLTLKPVRSDNSPQHWNDLIQYLNGIEGKKRIITDPVTGYMVSALTKHHSARKKFHRHWGGYIEFIHDDYSQHPFDKYNGYLFIINKRNGGESETGRIAGHWPDKILQVENYYPSEKLEEYINTNPERFNLLWEQNAIRVFSLTIPAVAD